MIILRCNFEGRPRVKLEIISWIAAHVVTSPTHGALTMNADSSHIEASLNLNDWPRM